MGFEEDVNNILNLLPLSWEYIMPSTKQRRIVSRQTTMFSATLSPSIEYLSKRYLRNPLLISIGEIGRPVDSVEQKVEFINEERKVDRTSKILKSFQPPIIVFVNTKRNVDYLTKLLEGRRFRCVGLHGGKSQSAREEALRFLKEKQKDILIATDVAGRGIDVPDVSLVLNFDMSKTIEDYIHRIGRTGRAGKSGTAISFLTANDSEIFYDLKVYNSFLILECNRKITNQ